MQDQKPHNMEKALKTIQLEITFPQLLDVSPRLHRELALLLQSSQPRSRKKKGRNTGLPPAVGQLNGPLQMTNAAEDTKVECLYITACCNGVKIPNVLVDGGAMIELILEELVTHHQLDKHPVKDRGIRLADQSLVRLPHYVWMNLNVEGIVVEIRAYIMPVKETYQILLSRRWLKRMKGVEDHRNNMLLIEGVDRIPREARGQPAPPADFEIIPGNNVSEENTILYDDEGEADQAIDNLLQELDKMNIDDDKTQGDGSCQL